MIFLNRLTFSLVLLSGCFTSVFAQFGNDENLRPYVKEHWVEGKIVLTDNRTLKGNIDFQENFDLVKIEVDNQVKTFNPKQVVQFSYFDEDEGRERLFISIIYDMAYQNRESWLFFEVLKEISNMALLSRKVYLERESQGGSPGMSPQTISTPYGPTTIPGTPSTSYRYSLNIDRETLYLANDKGAIEEFSEITYKEWRPRNTKILNKKLLKDFFGENYDACEEFIKDNKLSLKRKEDLIALLDYYERLN